MLLEGFGVFLSGLQLWVGSKEAGRGQRAEKVGVKYILCAGTRLRQLKQERKPGVLVILVVFVTS